MRARARNQIRRKFYQDRLRAELGTALEMALIDPLTGLYNQRYLMRHLRGLLGGPHAQELALLMIDVDHFKTVNDDYGHAAGDQALRSIAETLRANTRVFDSVARYGGEEFVVVMPGTASGRCDDCGGAAAPLRSKCCRSNPLPGRRYRLTISVGVACSQQPRSRRKPCCVPATRRCTRPSVAAATGSLWQRTGSCRSNPAAAATAHGRDCYLRMADSREPFEHRSTRTTGNDPSSGADPGGTHSTHPGQADKSAPRQEAPVLDQHVTSGDRNPKRESRLPRPPPRP